MNEMRKLMESLEKLEENEKLDIVTELEGLMAEIKSMVWEAKDLVRAGFGGDSVGYERAKYWIAAIETALDKDHDWLGGNMFTMEDTIQELKGEPDESDEYEDELEEDTYGDVEFDFDNTQGFVDYIGEQGARKYGLEIEDQFKTTDGYEMEIVNAASMTRGIITITDYDGVNFEMYRDRDDIHLDSHYFENLDKATADQILDLMNMPLENTIGRRPF